MMEFVNWDDYSIPNISGKIKHVSNHQPGYHETWFAGKCIRFSSTIFPNPMAYFDEDFPVSRLNARKNKQLAMKTMDGKWPIYFDNFSKLRKCHFPQQSVSLPKGLRACPKLENVRNNGVPSWGYFVGFLSPQLYLTLRLKQRPEVGKCPN